MSTARFKIRNLTSGGAWSPSTDAGFDCDEGDELELQLEDSPALDIWITIFSCTDKSADRTAPVFDPVSGTAATPTSGVSMTLPAAEAGTWAIQSQVNGGGDGSEEEAAAFTFTRYVAVRTANLDLRHPLAGETTQYLNPGGWAVAMQELLDAVDTAAPGAVPATRTLFGTAPIRINGGASGDLSADRTIAFIPNANVAMGGYGFTGIPSLANAAGAFSLTAGAGAVTIDASAGIDIGITTGTTIRIGRTGQTVRLPALGGSGAGIVAVDNSGNLSFSAASAASASAAYLVNAASATNVNDVPIQDLAAAITFYLDSGGYAVTVGCGSASAPGTYDALRLIATSGGTGGINRVAGLLFANQDADGDEVNTGRIGSYLSDATNTTTAGGLHFYTSTAGALALAATLDASKVWATVGAMRTDAGFDRSTAGALALGGTIATSVTLGSNSTATNIDHRVATSGSSRWYVNNVLQATLAAAAFTWSEGLSAPTFGIDARTSDAATTTVELTGQTPWASATGTNRNAGSVRVRIPSPTAGGAEGFFFVTISGADVMRGGRPSGTFEAELRFSPAATVLRPATIPGSTFELFGAGLVFSATNHNQRDVSQVLRVTRNITTAITDTFDASVTGYTWAWTQDGSAAGGNATFTGQRGASGFAGGSFAINVGDGGTLGTNAPGNFDVGLGTAVSSVTGKQRWMTVAGTAVIAQIGLAAGGYALLEGGAAATAGLQVASTAELVLAAGGSSDITFKTGGIGGTSQGSITTTRAAFTQRVEAPRFVGEVSTPTSTANAVTISLDAQNPSHTTTEATTVTISGGTNGQTGTILFSQGASGYTVTMPANGTGVEYDDAIDALTVTGIVDATAFTRTLLSYRILASGKAYIYARSVNTIP